MPRVYERLHYRIELDGKFLGCAWALEKDKLITCAHVAADEALAFRARQSYNPGCEANFRVEKTTGTSNWLRDASLLYAVRPGEDELIVSNEAGVWEPETGQDFLVFGFPDDKSNLGDFARYEIVQKLPNGWFNVEIKNLKGSELRGGYSGSPAWDPALNCVIGIVVGVDPKRREKIAYVIPPSTLREQVGEPCIRYPKFGPGVYETMLATNLKPRDVRRAEIFLSSAADSVADAVQRYWVYACLSTLAPDRCAHETVRRAIEIERDEYARRGATHALSKFKNV